jgi:hypothetical protein
LLRLLHFFGVKTIKEEEHVMADEKPKRETKKLSKAKLEKQAKKAAAKAK